MLRACWMAVWLLLAAWTPPALHPWRRLLLRLFGASMGARSDVRGSARVWYPPHLMMERNTLLAERVNCYNMARVTLREGALVSQGAYLCAGNHDIDAADFQLIARPITLGARCWVATEAFVAPGVTIGEGAVLGARAVAFTSLEPWTLYVGNPAQAKRPRKRPPPRETT
jgi:putative colanic acid biosynthesis acetyltransferase WcaF